MSVRHESSPNAAVTVLERGNNLDALEISLGAEQEDEATADIFTDLRLEKSLHPLTPLLKGTWE